MNQVILNSRVEKPAYFDMAGRLHWGAGCGRGFRIGDRAAAYIFLLDWRQRNPSRKLVVLDDMNYGECQSARGLDAAWLFRTIADEVWDLDPKDKVDFFPLGEPLYTDSLWHYWYHLRHYRASQLVPRICPRAESIITWENNHTSKRPYVTVQPLFDASYNIHRNIDPRVWYEVIIYFAQQGFDVVVLGLPDVLCHLKVKAIHQLPDCVFLYPTTSIQFSMAAVNGAYLHVGGETGLTIWSSIFRVPTIGVFVPVKSVWADVAPISFGSPVAVVPPDPIVVQKTFENLKGLYLV